MQEVKLQEQSAGLMNVLFKGADTPLSLKKRYKALMKIFHPDNVKGDDELVQWLNIEYSKLKQEMEDSLEIRLHSSDHRQSISLWHYR